MRDLKGKNIIVTGASGGIGNAIIEKLNQAEANILASGTRIEKLDELKNKFANIKILKFDISKTDKIEEFVENATKELGGSLDCIINNAGVTQGLKAIAKELALPVVALSQLSRQVEQRDDHKPQLADLRESGSIEQDADVVMFVYREGYYLQRKEPREATVEHAEWQAKMNEVAHLAQIIIGKQRHGPIGNVTLEFEERFTKFKDTQTN